MIIDANMYWIPEEFFSSRSLSEEFLRSASRASGVYAYETLVPDTGKKQIVIEKPKGCQNLNYVEGQYALETQLTIFCF